MVSPHPMAAQHILLHSVSLAATCAQQCKVLAFANMLQWPALVPCVAGLPLRVACVGWVCASDTHCRLAWLYAQRLACVQCCCCTCFVHENVVRAIFPAQHVAVTTLLLVARAVSLSALQTDACSRAATECRMGCMLAPGYRLCAAMQVHVLAMCRG